MLAYLKYLALLVGILRDIIKLLKEEKRYKEKNKKLSQMKGAIRKARETKDTRAIEHMLNS